MGGGEHGLAEDSGLFQVAIGETSGHVLFRHEFSLDVVGECVTPQDRSGFLSEEHPSHSCFRGVGRANNRRQVGHYFCESCGTFREADGQTLKVIDVVPDVLADAYTVLVRVL
jgi:hypothetical protein